jgi:hypothetical protein
MGDSIGDSTVRFYWRLTTDYTYSPLLVFGGVGAWIFVGKMIPVRTQLLGTTGTK